MSFKKKLCGKNGIFLLPTVKLYLVGLTFFYMGSSFARNCELFFFSFWLYFFTFPLGIITVYFFLVSKIIKEIQEIKCIHLALYYFIHTVDITELFLNKFLVDWSLLNDLLCNFFPATFVHFFSIWRLIFTSFPKYPFILWH